MAYKYSKGKTFQGDIYNEDDTQQNTYLDWSEDAVGFITGGELSLTVSGSTNEVSSSYNLSASAFYGDGSGLTGITATASPAGSSTYVQYNDAGSTGGSSGFVYDGDGIVGLTASSNAYASLGIGITSPGAPLHIYEDNSPTVRIQKAAGTNVYTDFVQAGNGMYLYTRYGATDGIYIWYGYGGGVANHYATLNAHGLGIKRAPAANTNLHISGSDSDTMINVNSDSNNNIFVVMGDGDVGIGTSSPTSTFEVSGSQAGNYTEVSTAGSSSLTLDGTHYIVDYTGDGAGRITLPNVSGITGRTYHIISHNQNETAALTITGSGGQFQGPNLDNDSDSIDIDGWTPQSVTVVSTGGNWFILTDNRSQGPE